jgi:hypothetical protein
MAYDSPDFRVQLMHGPIFASFAAIIVTGASSETQTSEDSRDRVEFFRNVKLLDFHVLPKTGITQGGAAAGNTYKVQLMVGSDVVASCTLAGTADAGVMKYGSIGSGTLAEVTSNEEMSLRLAITGDGTDSTHTANSLEAYILYEHRFA